MPGTMEAPKPFPFHKLPAEMQVEVMRNVIRRNQTCVITSKAKLSGRFRSKYKFTFFNGQYTLLASFPEFRPTYQDVLGDYILNEAHEVVINVKDLDFTNMRAFFNTLARRNKLGDFVYHGEIHVGGPQSRRWLKVNYINTKAFPSTFESVLDFTRISNKILEKLPGFPKGTARSSLCITTDIHSCEDLPAVAHAQDDLFVKGAMGEFFMATITSFLQYRAAMRFAEQQKLDDQKEYWEEINATVAGGFADPAEHAAVYGVYEAAVAMQQTQAAEEEAVGGVEEDKEMEEEDPRNGAADHGMDSGDVDMEIEEDVEIREEDIEEEPRGTLYEPPQQTVAYNPGGPSFRTSSA